MTSARGQKAPVIKDVAALAGVSVPTVSRVLRGADYVSDEKREKVLQAISELNYRPSPEARALVERNPRLIAVLTSDTSRYGYAETIRGIEEAARASQQSVSIAVLENAEPDVVARTVHAVMGQPIAGVVVLEFDDAGIEAVRHLPADFPAVTVAGHPHGRLPQARIAEAEGAEQVVALLLELGHDTVHHVRVPPPGGEHPRTVGWRDALLRAGRVLPQPIDVGWEPESGRLAGHRIAQDPTITAVFCGNDEVAMGVLRGLAEHGRRVPDDVSVVGFDDHPLAAMWVPSLTTVRQDFAALGSEAFGMLSSLDLTAAADEKVLPATPVRRESIGPPPVVPRS